MVDRRRQSWWFYFYFGKFYRETLIAFRNWNSTSCSERKIPQRLENICLQCISENEIIIIIIIANININQSNG